MLFRCLKSSSRSIGERSLSQTMLRFLDLEQQIREGSGSRGEQESAVRVCQGDRVAQRRRQRLSTCQREHLLISRRWELNLRADAPNSAQNPGSRAMMS